MVGSLLVAGGSINKKNTKSSLTPKDLRWTFINLGLIFDELVDAEVCEAIEAGKVYRGAVATERFYRAVFFWCGHPSPFEKDQYLGQRDDHVREFLGRSGGVVDNFTGFSARLRFFTFVLPALTRHPFRLTQH